MLNIMVIEDSPEEMAYCSACIEACLPECRIFQAWSHKEALELLLNQKIDLFFIDVELPDGNGFQLAKMIRSRQEYLLTTIVFVTAVRTDQLQIHRQYHHYEYLEKPYLKETFQERIGPVLKVLDSQQDTQMKVPKERDKVLLIPQGRGIKYVKVADLYYVESQLRKLRLVTNKGELTNLKLTIEELLQKANLDYVVRTHKSFVANLQNVIELKPEGRRNWNLYFDNEKQIACPVGVTYCEQVRRQLQEINEK